MKRSKQQASWRERVTPQSLVERYDSVAESYGALIANPAIRSYLLYTTQPSSGHERLSPYDTNRCEEASDHGASLLAEKLVTHLTAILPRVPHKTEAKQALFAGYNEDVAHDIYTHAQQLRDAIHRVHGDVDAVDMLIDHLPKGVRHDALAHETDDVYRAATAPQLRIIDKALRAMKADITRMKHMHGTHDALREAERAVLDQCSVTLEALKTMHTYSVQAAKAGHTH